ncbi:MAG TPA: hypothetical protein PKA10_20275, partial [Selenomonadales bacterium]|nr:hypothetical protein [Selenomonadales bacterium]
MLALVFLRVDDRDLAGRKILLPHRPGRLDGDRREAEFAGLALRRPACGGNRRVRVRAGCRGGRLRFRGRRCAGAVGFG